MMEDLDNKYIEEELRKSGIAIEIENNKYIASFSIDDKIINLSIFIDSAFPYEFPAVHIEEESREYLIGIPHIESDDLLCCFDSSLAIPNVFCPNDIIVSCFIQAKNTVMKGISNYNKSDIIDEFCAYWRHDSDKEKSFYLMSELADKCKLLYFNNNDVAFIHNDKEYLINKLNDLRIQYKKSGILKCFYVPLNNPISTIPKTHAEVDTIIKNNSNFYYEYVSFLMNDYSRGHLIILSQVYNDSYMFFAFLHNRLPQNAGFRKGKTPLAISLITTLGKEPITRFNISNINQTRLFKRGGDGIINNNHIGIIGCGSLGSHIAEAFASCGVSKYTLVDRELLLEDNIARHVLGFNYIETAKAASLKYALQKHNPNIDCYEFSEDANKLLEDKPEVFHNVDSIICTAANSPLEVHLVDKYNQGSLCKTLVIMWVEPYALCGHVLLLNTPQDIVAEFFNDELCFNDPVIKSSDTYYKREAGCYSTYMPYSGLNVKLFAGSFVKDYIQGKYEKHNYHIIWTGDIHHNSFGVELNEKWEGLSDNSIYVERIK